MNWVVNATNRLRELAEKYIPEGQFAGTVVENGTVYKEIVEAARDLKIDQIIMGAHRPSLADFLLGPNSARVARHAGCTVTVTRQ